MDKGRTLERLAVEPEPRTPNDVLAHVAAVLRGLPVDVADEVARVADVLVARYQQDQDVDLGRLGRRLVGTAARCADAELPEIEEVAALMRGMDRANHRRVVRMVKRFIELLPAAETEPTPTKPRTALERITAALARVTRYEASGIADMVEKKTRPTERLSRRCSAADRIARCLMELTADSQQEVAGVIERWAEKMTRRQEAMLLSSPAAPKDSRSWRERLADRLRGYELSRVAELLGWKRQRIYAIVRRGVEPNIDEAMQICKHLGVTVEEVFG
jgi:DNA-binding XRE family transcriptional regulator